MERVNLSESLFRTLYLHYYSEMLTQILSSYRDFHYKFLVFVSDNGPSEEEQYIDELMAYQIEGLIVLSHTLSSEKLASYQIPVIAIEREAEHICGVTSDNYMGALQAATLLIRDKCDVLIHVNADVPKLHPMPMTVSVPLKIPVRNITFLMN